MNKRVAADPPAVVSSPLQRIVQQQVAKRASSKKKKLQEKAVDKKARQKEHIAALPSAPTAAEFAAGNPAREEESVGSSSISAPEDSQQEEALEEEMDEARRETERAEAAEDMAARAMEEYDRIASENAELKEAMQILKTQQREAASAALDSALRQSLQEQQQRAAAAVVPSFIPGGAQFVASPPAFKVEAPAELTYEGAGGAGALEDWLFHMERFFEKCALDGARRIQVATQTIDRHLWLWWQGEKDRLRALGEEHPSWEHFKASIKAQFVVETEERATFTELLNAKQQQGESFTEYFNRVQMLRLRANAAVMIPEVLQVRMLVERMRRETHPFTYAKARSEVEAGRIKTIPALRAFVQQEAMVEPPSQQRRAEPSPASGSSSTGKPPGGKQYGNPRRHPHKRVNAAGVEEGGEDTQVNMARRERPRGTPDLSKVTCHRCNQQGHFASSCDKPDMRLCYLCDKAGHVVRDCPMKRTKKAGTEGAPNPSASRPSNQ